MDQSSQPSQPVAAATTTHARRNEDIALDLLRFVAGSTNILRTTVPSTGFTSGGTPKPEDQVTLLLELYGRCLSTVQGKPEAR